MKITRAISLFLAAVMLLLVFCACQNGKEKETGKDTTGAVTTGAVSDTGAETDVPSGKKSVKDNLPDDLNYNGRTIHILLRELDDDNIVADKESDDVVSQAVYRRNLLVEDRLSVSLDPIVRPGGAADMPALLNAVSNEILTGSDAYDICDTFQATTVKLSTSGMMAELTDLPYLDREQPWWWSDYNSSLNLEEDHIYMLQGDFNCVTGNEAMSAIYFNKTVMSDLKYDVNDFYKKVLDGEWYYDDLLTMSNSAYSDLNGNTVPDEGDRFGMNLNIDEAEHFTYTAEVTLSDFDENGRRVLNLDNVKHMDFLALLDTIYHDSIGTFYVELSTNTSEELSLFAGNKLLFYPRRLVHAAAMRGYEVSYGIIPYPKYQETQTEYHSIVQNNAPVVWIPFTAKDPDAVSAVLEALSAEGYRQVLDAFYEKALKIKSTEVEDDSAIRCIDLIHDGVRCEFAYIWSDLLNNSGLICRTVANVGSDAVTSSIERIKVQSATALANLYEAYQKMNEAQ